MNVSVQKVFNLNINKKSPKENIILYVIVYFTQKKAPIFCLKYIRAEIIGLLFVNHKSISWFHPPKMCKTSINYESFFLKYNKFKTIIAGDICLSICLELNHRDSAMNKKIPQNVLACFKPFSNTLTWKNIKTITFIDFVNVIIDLNSHTY